MGKMTMTKPPYTLTNESITVVWNGVPHTVKEGAPNFKALRDAIALEEWDKIEDNLSVKRSIESWSNDKFKIDGNRVFYNGEDLPTELTRRIVSMASNGEDPTIIFNFWERLSRNPSFRSVQQLWTFLVHSGIPFTPDGCFLAYKGVRSDYRDAHSGKIDNRPGTVNKMPRNKISDDPDVACHFGFHVGAYNYANTFSQRVVICKVDPEHVVCVPKDSNWEKMRVCEYEVVGNYGTQLPSVTFHERSLAATKSSAYEQKSADKEYEGYEESVDEDAAGDEDGENDAPEQNLDIDDGDNDNVAVVGDEDENEEEDRDPWEPTHADADREQKKADKKANKKSKKPKSRTKKNADGSTTTKKPMKKFSSKAKFDHMDFKMLMDQSIDDLRKYATYGLHVVGASKISGGKTALVKRITSVR